MSRGTVRRSRSIRLRQIAMAVVEEKGRELQKSEALGAERRFSLPVSSGVSLSSICPEGNVQLARWRLSWANRDCPSGADTQRLQPPTLAGWPYC